SMVAVMNISFDKSEADEAGRAQACYDQATQRLLAHGYIPYRSSLAGMGHLVEPGDVFWEVTQDIKSALDPAGILAPGRYIPL
ncbi:MAG: FAD-linked oxidase, partial [Candidatus Hydrogenedentes bacterium]|nr:FAD-linked oxidase [Candidatus Hydrogenedentota bacterium]